MQNQSRKEQRGIDEVYTYLFWHMLFHKGLTSFLLIRIQMLLKQQTKPVPVQTVDVSNYIKKNRFHLNQDNKLNKKRL